MAKVHEYRGEDIVVTYDLGRCIHAAECVKGSARIFNPKRTPWVDPDQATADEVADVVSRCPTGALQYERLDGGPAEAAPETNRCTIEEAGPLQLHGSITVRGPDGDVRLEDTRVALCRCGLSVNKPFCDGSHEDWDPGSDPQGRS